MKALRILSLLALAGLFIFGCTSSESDPASPTTQYKTFQSDADSVFSHAQYWLQAFDDTDSALSVKITPNQSGKLSNVKIMFGDWTVDAVAHQVTPVVVKVFAAGANGPSGTALATKNVAASAITQNAAGRSVWTNVNFDDVNVNITNATAFYVTVTPLFSSSSTTNQERMYVRCEQSTPGSNNVLSYALEDDGSFVRVTDTDFAIAAEVSY